MVKLKKRKPNAKERALQAEEQKMWARHSAPLELGAKAKGIRVTASTLPVAPPKDTAPMSTEDYQRKFCGSTAPRSNTQYTGTKMLGVGQMAKSNAVPVFSVEEATEIARMRRG